MNSWVALLATVALLAFTALPSTADPQDVPLPDLTMVAPDESVSKEMAAFASKWYGVWSNVLEHVLVVEEIAPSYTIVVYAVGVAPQWRINEPRWFRQKAELIKDRLTIKFVEQGITVIYRMNKDGTLSATYDGPTGFARAKMVKIPE